MMHPANTSARIAHSCPQPVAPLTRREFEQIASLAHSAFGLEIREGKELMVASRLLKCARHLNCRTFSEYYQLLVNDTSRELLSDMIDALTTNFTKFFREEAHFEFLRTVIVPELRTRKLFRIWCAGAATGEEPYSIALCLLDAFGAGEMPELAILATDISNRALQTAELGIYPPDKTCSLRPELVRNYFTRGEGEWRGWRRVKPDVRRLIHFRRLNLIERLPNLGLFPVIFCRNVMIYFDRRTQIATVNRLAELLEPGGYLIIGHSESLAGADTPLEYVRPAVYRRPFHRAPQRTIK